MAYKTAAELFGDNAGFGVQVPIDFGPPAGVYDPTNRGIGFGEQLTSAIANRSHWALGENTDDLNTRLSIFETDGLDAAYRGGALAVPGSGRLITKDGDAVETVSAHALLSTDDTHFRANAIADTVGSSFGFEFVGKRSASDGQSGDDSVAGLLDRRVFASATGATQLKHNEPAFLNPTGALPTTVRIPGGSFHVAGSTDLARNYDLVQINGTAASDGLYIFSSIGLLTTDAVLEKIDGTSPVFSVNEACTISVYRVKLGSFGAYTGRGRLYGTSIVGSPQSLSALDVVPGANKSTDLSGGASAALRIMRRGLSGSTTASAEFDLFGRTTWAIPRSSLLTDYDKNVNGGGFATRVEAQESGMAGHQVVGEAAISDRFDFTSLQEIDGALVGITPFVAQMQFTATSAATGEVFFDAAYIPTFEFDSLVPGVGGLVSILNTPSTNSDGLYWIHSTIISGNKGFYLRCLDGSLPGHFPAAGSFTLGRIYAGSVIGRRLMIDNPNPVEAGDTNKPVLANILTSTNEVGATALGLVATRDPVGLGERSLIRGYRPAPAATDNYQEVFKVGSNGDIYTAANVFAGVNVAALAAVQGNTVSATTTVTATTDVFAGNDFRLTTPVSKRFPINLLAFTDLASATPWSRPSTPDAASSYYVVSNGNDARLLLPLNQYLREGMLLNNIRVIVTPGASRANGPPIGDHRTAAFCVYVDPNFAVPAAPSRTLVGQAEDNGTNVIQLMTVPCGGHVVNRVGTGGRDYFLVLKAGDTGAVDNDTFYGVEIEVTDEYVRNV